MEPIVNIASLKERNRIVFRAFFKAHYTNLVAYAHGFLFDRGASEDVVQEVFIKFWEKLPHLNITGTPKGYVYAMVRNACLNHLKKIKVTDTTHLLEMNNMVVASYDFDDYSLENKRLIYNQILKIVEELPPKMRQIFEMRYFYNYKYNEIAEELDVSVNTVKIQLRRSKVRIADMLSALLLLLASS
ncbi:RNA polymerase sigma factor [Sediminicola luteus]|uniref:RNA polymerase sigma factor n=1 Tax=Sediminicola luteus TaxID=319238 RepID=UPI001552B90F|nr:RNA polymerase sigma-70 factor [Sediminicola luteus]